MSENTGNHSRGKESMKRYQVEIPGQSVYGLKSIMDMIMEKSMNVKTDQQK